MANLEALFQQFKAGYENDWQNMQIRPGSAGQANKEAARLLKNKSIYQQIETITHVPWYFIGLCHDRESGFDLNTYLGNGQALNRVTTIVPKGRGPFLGPNAFVDGAVDALRIQGFVGATDWSIARTLFRLEGFNGFGYHSRGVNSPYLWSGSTVYGPPEERAGKFVADGVFDPNKVDPQLGVAVILKELMGLDNSIIFGVAPSAPSGSPEPDVSLADDVLHVQQSLNKLGIDPQLVEDGINGPRTKAAISLFQQQNGLNDTGLPDAVTIAAITKRSVQPIVAKPTPDVLSQILQRMQTLEKTLPSLNNSTTTPPAPTNPNDPVNIIERVLSIVQKINLQPGPGTTVPVPSGTPSTDQLKQVKDVITAVIGQTPTSDVLSQILQRMQPSLSNSTTTPPAPTNPNDPVNIIERILGIVQKINLQPGTGTTMPVPSGTPSADQLKQVIDVITAVIGQTKPPLGQVNGALGETIGNLLNGKKTAIGIGGSLITSLLAAVTSSPNAGGLAGLLGTIATSVPGLSQFTLPIFLAITAWGVLGKIEKWSQGTAPPPKPQV
jgi:lysozyme family protein/peptidoglycan hydrolase-like protein with peptidoglycan-binding domain